MENPDKILLFLYILYENVYCKFITAAFKREGKADDKQIAATNVSRCMCRVPWYVTSKREEITKTMPLSRVDGELIYEQWRGWEYTRSAPLESYLGDSLPHVEVWHIYIVLYWTIHIINNSSAK